MKAQTTQPQPAKKLTLKKTSIRVLVHNDGNDCGPTANCSAPC